MRTSTLARATAVSALVALAGCYTRQVVLTPELYKLDGFDSATARPAVLATEDGPYDFAAHPVLYLEENGDRELGGDFHHIAVGSGHFAGVTNAGQTLNVDLANVQRGEVEELSTVKTGLLVGAVVLGALVALVGIMAASCQGKTDCGPG
jgi:hypothetical protein